MLTKLKICGITNIDDALMCAGLGVDWLGFNFFPESPRYIAPEDARQIIDQLPQGVESIGILVKPTLEQAKTIIEKTHIKRVQIYGPQDFDNMEILEIPVIISYRISEDANLSLEFLGAEMILLDSYSKDTMGGTGESFNWALIPPYISRQKLVLAGGIRPENIRDALHIVKPAVIDVASGSESEPGKKDPEKVARLMKEINRFNEKQKDT